MSNIANTIDFLRINPDKRFITITVVGTEQQVGGKEIYLKDIPQENLAAYIKQYLGHLTAPVVIYIELREYRGAASKKVNSYSAQITPDNYQKEEVKQPVSMVQENQPYQQNYGSALHGPASASGMISVPITEVMNSHKNESKVENLKEKIDELKEDKVELKDKIRRIQKKYDDADTEVRHLKSELSIATSQKDMAVMFAKSENASWIDKIPFDKLIEKAPELMGHIVAMKGGTPAGALGATANLSPEKQGFIEYVTEELTDNEADLLGRICTLLKTNPQFYPQLQQLIINNSN